MSNKDTLLAIDLGAESGRGVSGRFDGKKLALEEVHRFANQPITIGETLHWNMLGIFANIETAIEKAKAAGAVKSVGVDTWGVDFGLMDSAGHLIGNPVHYRDRRTEGIFQKAYKIVPKEEIFSNTGNMFYEFNTLFQLLALRLADDPSLKMAERLLNTPDLLHYWLCGEMANELTIASTTQCMSADRKAWATELLRKFDIPQGIFGEIVPPATRLGALRTDKNISVVLPASHDTGSAVMAVPAHGDDFLWISSGTWSIVGVVNEAPIAGPQALAHNFTNESIDPGRNRFSRNVMGLWIIQECRREWARQGKEYTYPELVGMAKQSAPFRSLIIPDDIRFLRPGQMPDIIKNFCASTGQPVPQTEGEIARCIFESLALAYKEVLDSIETVTKRTIKRVHIIGGGSQNALLCQFTADATRLPVLAGPVEATAIGNLLAQAKAHGWVKSNEEMTQVVLNSFPTEEYSPAQSDAWEESYGRYKSLCPQSD